MREIRIFSIFISRDNKTIALTRPLMPSSSHPNPAVPPSLVGRLLADGRLYAFMAAAGFSMKAIFVKLAYDAGPVSPLGLLALRMGLALPLFVWLLWRSKPSNEAALSTKDYAMIAFTGFMGYYLSSLFDFYGLQHISAGLERMILFLYPTMVLLMQACITRKAPTRNAWLAMGICYSGLLIAFAHDLKQADGANVLVGSAWVFLCAITYAIYYVGTGQLVGRVGSMRLAGLAGIFSSFFTLAHFFGSGEAVQLGSLPLTVWVHAALMALFSTVLPILWLALAIERLGATQSATIGTLGPILTVFLAWLLLGESLSLFQLVGLALVMLGVARLKPGAGATPPASDPKPAR